MNIVLNNIAIENNVEVVGREFFTEKDRDFRTIITKLIAKNPDAIYAGVPVGQVSSFINQLKDLKYKGKILTYGPSVLGEGIQDQITDKSNVYYPEPLVKQETDFWTNYKEKTSKEADLIIGVGYDSMKIIESGLKECGENNDCIRDYFLNLESYPTTRGKINYDEDGDLLGVDFEIKILGSK
jgi:branched-chain amino acid transport system substrate-binding protein